MATNSIFSSEESRRRWAEEIEANFNAKYLYYPEQYCVYKVPESFTETKPEAYAPRRVGLGPYHSMRPDLYKMHKDKLAAVRETLPPEKLDYIRQVASSLREAEPVVRACYEQFLDLGYCTLSWIMAADGLFLFRYLKSALEGDGTPVIENLAGDIFMLENQIPSILLKLIGVFYRRCLVRDDSDKVHEAYVDFLLNGGFLALCQKNSPFKLSSEWAIVKDTKQMHLLHCLYYLIVNYRRADDEMVLCDGVGHRFEVQEDPTWGSPTVDEVDPPCTMEDINQNADNVNSMLDQVFPVSVEAHSSLTIIDGQPKMRDKSLAHLLNHMYRLVNIIVANNIKVPVITSISPEDIQVVTEGIGFVKSSLTPLWENAKRIPDILNDLGVPGAGTASRVLSIISQVPWDKVSALQGSEPAPPPVEQIEIPTISEMSKILGITFAETPGGIRDVKFDKKERKLYLPAITLNTHSETIVRNLLAFEAASAKPESCLELAEYVDMMCGMIDEKFDVEILRKAGIIKGDQLLDDEIVGIFNGIRKTTGEGEGKSNISKAISDINKMYSNTWRVKAKRMLGEFASSGVKYANVIVTMVVVVLLMTQAFCTVFGCTRRFGKSAVNLQFLSDH